MAKRFNRFHFTALVFAVVLVIGLLALFYFGAQLVAP